MTTLEMIFIALAPLSTTAAIFWALYTTKKIIEAGSWLKSNRIRIIERLSAAGYELHTVKSGKGLFFISERGRNHKIGKPCGVITSYENLKMIMSTTSLPVIELFANTLMRGGKK